ncbi:MAG: peptide deformylase [Clostridia bacterium]|jgi:peptide deformylase|nr:peptide deformylase [Clostridia bacterium]
MAKLKILKIGDETLRRVSRPVDAITPRIQRLLDDMIDTMRAADGVGLAAPQVGVLRRIVVIETPDEGLIELINPKIIAYSGEQESEEGCLSVPGRYGITKRPMNVTVRALDRNGKTFDITGSGLLAKAFCHEIDHLDGKLYVDVALRMLDN